MFKFLKEKLGKAISSFTRKAEETAEKTEPGQLSDKDKESTVTKQEIERKLPTKSQVEKKKAPLSTPSFTDEKSKEPELTQKKPVEPAEQIPPAKEPYEEKDAKDTTSAGDGKKGIFSKFREKVTKTVLKDEKFDQIFWDIEITLLENNVAIEVIEKIKEDLKNRIVGQAIPRGKMADKILSSLKLSITEILETDTFDIFRKMEEKKPFVVCFIGVNGSGKTTTIAKIAKQLNEKGKKVVLAASDTFRAAAIDQLTIHADKVGAKIIKHDYGSDAAAVAFDAVEHAKSKDKDVVLIDTAGRIHSNTNLMDELKKVVRVVKPDLKIFVGESITGNDCIEQAKNFDKAVGIDGLILTKADIDEKGGTALSISYVTKKPILLIGIGQEYNDLKQFKPATITDSLGL